MSQVKKEFLVAGGARDRRRGHRDACQTFSVRRGGHLRQHGFVFHKFEPTVSRTIAPMLVNNDIYAGMSQLLWADAIFVKDFTRLDLLTERQLLSMATIMHDCYRSFDLALRLLTEHDARAGTRLGANYLSRLQTLSAAKAA